MCVFTERNTSEICQQIKKHESFIIDTALTKGNISLNFEKSLKSSSLLPDCEKDASKTLRFMKWGSW